MLNEDVIEIYIQDLKEEKQKEIIETFGENRNYDVFPIAEIPINMDFDDDYDEDMVDEIDDSEPQIKSYSKYINIEEI